jgi:hypothetical protein
MPITAKTCLGCPETFETHRRNQSYHSPQCRKKAWLGQRNEAYKREQATLAAPAAATPKRVRRPADPKLIRGAGWNAAIAAQVKKLMRDPAFTANLPCLNLKPARSSRLCQRVCGKTVRQDADRFCSAKCLRADAADTLNRRRDRARERYTEKKLSAAA